QLCSSQTPYGRLCAWVLLSLRRRMHKETPNLLSTLTSSTGRGRFAAGFVSLAFALGTAGPALADDSTGSIPDPGAVLPTLTTSTAAAPTPPDITPTSTTTAPPPASTADTVANTASMPSMPPPVSVESVVSAPVSTTLTVAPPVQASPAPPPAPLPTPDPAPAPPAPAQPASPAQAPAPAPVPAVSTSTPTAAPSPAPAPSSATSATAPAAPVSAQPQQYQTPNIADTNSSPNTSTTSGAKTPQQSETLPSASGSTLVWNSNLNDLVSCSFCNVSISVRVL